MDTETVWGLIMGAIAGAEITSIAGIFIADRKAKKVAPIIDRDYGPKIKENLARLEAAVQAGDKNAALAAVNERSALFVKLNNLSSGYFRYSARAVGSPYQGHASAEVKSDIAKGASLESYLKA